MNNMDSRWLIYKLHFSYFSLDYWWLRFYLQQKLLLIGTRREDRMDFANVQNEMQTENLIANDAPLHHVKLSLSLHSFVSIKCLCYYDWHQYNQCPLQHLQIHSSIYVRFRWHSNASIEIALWFEIHSLVTFTHVQWALFLQIGQFSLALDGRSMNISLCRTWQWEKSNKQQVEWTFDFLQKLFVFV